VINVTRTRKRKNLGDQCDIGKNLSDQCDSYTVYGWHAFN